MWYPPDPALGRLGSRSRWQRAALRLGQGHYLHFCLLHSPLWLWVWCLWEHGRVESWQRLWYFITDTISSGKIEAFLSSSSLGTQMHRHPLGVSPKLLFFSHSVMSDFLQPHGLHHARFPCPSPSPEACSNIIESVMPSNYLILCSPFLLPPWILPSIRVFSNESVLCIRWPKDWHFSFRISPSNEYSGLISFRIAWFDLLAVQGTLKSLLQHHSSKASILQCSAFFMVRLSHPYMTTGKIIALTIWTIWSICR